MAPHGDELDYERIALGVQQPWAELIVRGIKTLEIRSQSTRQRGRIYHYASKRPSNLETAAAAIRRHHLVLESLPLGLLVRSVEIVGCRPCRPSDQRSACVPPEILVGRFAWELSSPRALAVPAEVRFLPYGIWFYPFKRRMQTEH